MPTTHDGREVASDSEAWREHCEAVTVLALPSRPARSAYLERVEKHRGKPARERLQTIILSIHHAKSRI